MTVMPIPRELLIHRCVLNRYRDGGIFGNGELISSVILSNVRCRAACSKKSSSEGERIEKSGVLYFDCENSSPEDAVFLSDGCRSEVVFEGEVYAVTGVRYIYGTTGLHHLEVALG